MSLFKIEIDFDVFNLCFKEDEDYEDTPEYEEYLDYKDFDFKLYYGDLDDIQMEVNIECYHVINFLHTGKMDVRFDYSTIGYSIGIDRDEDKFFCWMMDSDTYAPSFQIESKQGKYLYKIIKKEFSEKIKNLDAFINRWLADKKIKDKMEDKMEDKIINVI